MTTQPTAQIGGLASGLDTTSIINQLIQLDSQTQTTLKNRVSTEQTSVSALQALNTAIAGLATKAQDLAGGFGATGWTPLISTSTLDSVTATPSAGSTGSTAGSVTFTVDQLATAHAVRFVSTAASSDVVTGSATTVLLTTSTGTATLDSGDGTLSGLVRVLNASGTGVTASTVRLDDGTLRLSLTSTTTGAASPFTLTAADGSAILGGATVTTQGLDAAVTVGGDTIHSSTNTFTGLLGGIDVTLGAGTTVGATATVATTRDSAAITKSVQALVDGLNSALDLVGRDTAYDSTKKTAGPLSNEPSVRALRNALANTLWPSDGTTMASVGIQVDRTGHFVFDATAFGEAFARDPVATAAMFTTGSNGFAARVQAVAKSASDPYQGTLTNAVTSHTSSIKVLQDQISSWDDRLAMRRQTLTAQFSALETAMSRMQAQSSWLTSQLASLPTMNSKSS